MPPSSPKGQRSASRVVVALGSNQCHGRHGRPESILRAAIAALAAGGLHMLAVAPIRATPPLGPSNRRFANGAVLGLWEGRPLELLAMCKAVEKQFGRRNSRRWAARVLDCDLILFEQQQLRLPGLHVPHDAMAQRRFVLEPLVALWPDWRHPKLHLTARQMLARLRKPRPVAQDSTPNSLAIAANTP